MKKIFSKIKESLSEITNDIWNFWENNKIYLMCTILYFYISFKILGGTKLVFFYLLLIYILSLITAFSPIGEYFLRLLNNVRPLETLKEKEYIKPLFQEVYEQVKLQNKYIGKIEICVIDSMTINAIALGRHTIAVTKGAVQTFTEEQLKAVMAHEIAHIVNGDTIAVLYALIGNGIFTIIVILNKIILCTLENLINGIDGRKVFGFLAGLLRGIFEASVILLTFIFQAIMMINSRKNEFRADRFSYDSGYDREIIEVLYLLEKISLGDNGTIIQKMLAGHPRITKRIEYLENLDEQSEYKLP